MPFLLLVFFATISTGAQIYGKADWPHNLDVVVTELESKSELESVP